MTASPIAKTKEKERCQVPNNNFYNILAGEKGPSGHMMTSRDASSEVETNPNDAASLPMTENIATRWYCAPEILVGSSNYSTGVDIWAIGCILGELLAKKTIFPGNNTVHQLELILQVTGPPTRSDIESMQVIFLL